MEEYTIVDFLKALTDDKFEKEFAKLISEGYSNEALLEKLLSLMQAKKNAIV
jgi:hypothetical protein